MYHVLTWEFEEGVADKGHVAADLGVKSNDSTRTADGVVKGNIPDFQRDQLKNKEPWPLGSGGKATEQGGRGEGRAERRRGWGDTSG